MRYPSVHSSIAGGAGYLSPIAGTLLEILDRVLVDGYNIGSTDITALGWTRPFDRYLNRSVYRPNAGLQLLYQISDNATVADYMAASVTAFESMADVNTGFGPWGSIYMGKCSSASPVDGPKYTPAWWIVGDSRGFYLLIGDHESYIEDGQRGIPVVVHYIGDFDSLQAGDAFNTLMLGHTNPTLLPSATADSFFKGWDGLGVASANGTVYAAATGGTLGVSVGLVTPDGNRGIGSANAAVNPLNMSLGAAIPHLHQMLISDAGADVPRGKMPGLYSVWPHIAGKTGDTFTNAAGDMFMIINFETAADIWGQYALQLNAW